LRPISHSRAWRCIASGCAAATDNSASLRVIARLGFRFEGIARQAELVGSALAGSRDFRSASAVTSSVLRSLGPGPKRFHNERTPKKNPFPRDRAGGVLIVGLAAGIALAVLARCVCGRRVTTARAAFEAAVADARGALGSTSRKIRSAVLERAGAPFWSRAAPVSAAGSVIIDDTQGAPPKARYLAALGRRRRRDYDFSSARALLSRRPCKRPPNT